MLLGGGRLLGGLKAIKSLAASLARGAASAVTIGLLGTVTNKVAFAVASEC